MAKIKYVENEIKIHQVAFDKDFDDIGWEPEIVDDDYDEDAANKYGY